MAAVVVAVVGAAGCDFDPGTRAELYGEWERVPPSPLGARESATVAWTGEEVLIIGGSDAPPCPPNAGCRPTSKPTLRDGAAYNPRTRVWRRIADAPVGHEFASGGPVRIGTTIYVLTPESYRPGSPRALLAYDFRADRWKRLPAPPTRRKDADYTLIAAAGRLVAFDLTGGQYSPGRPRVYEAGADTWEVLPPDPLGKDLGRWMVGTSDRLLSFDCRHGGRDGDECFVTAAAFDFASGRWTRFPDSTIHSTPGGFMAVGDVVVDPSLGDSHTDRQDPSGPAYRKGGILDVATGTWKEVPNRPTSEHDFGVGVLTERSADYKSHRGAILDLARKTWWRLPEMPGNRADASRDHVAAGRDLFVYGGADNNDAGDYVVLGDAWIWKAPPPE